MANRAPVRTNNSALIAMIADEVKFSAFLFFGCCYVCLELIVYALFVLYQTIRNGIEPGFSLFSLFREDMYFGAGIIHVYGFSKETGSGVSKSHIVK